jgi:hypothetical protein
MLSREDDPHLEAARRRRNRRLWRRHQRGLAWGRFLRRLRGVTPILLLLGLAGALGVGSLLPGRAAAPGLGAPAVAPRSCSEARALGIAPMRRGQPGYAPHLDADGDGIACEAGWGWRDILSAGAAQHR